MTHKEEELYTAAILKIQILIPQLQPTNIMSDWKKNLGTRLSISIQEQEYMDVGSISLNQSGKLYKSGTGLKLSK